MLDSEPICFISLWLLLTTMINPILSLISIRLCINYLVFMLISFTLLFFDNSFDTNMPIAALGLKIGPAHHDSAFRLHLNYGGKPIHSIAWCRWLLYNASANYSQSALCMLINHAVYFYDGSNQDLKKKGFSALILSPKEIRSIYNSGYQIVAKHSK